MIPLRLPASVPEESSPFVVRVNLDFGMRLTARDSYLVDEDATGSLFDGPGGKVRIGGIASAALDGDVLLVVPDRGVAHRLIRAQSPDNTLLVTEQCDQRCIMCSQPPKPDHVDLFAAFETALILAPEGAVIGLSGGEPTLHKHELFGMLRNVLRLRSDISFHILTNAQHFVEEDVAVLRTFPTASILWGVPLYASNAAVHDQIVAKQGAHPTLLGSLALLARSGAAIELRTVVMSENASHLPALARFITANLPFVRRWAIMQLEHIGYARRAWRELFFDTSLTFEPIAMAADLAQARGISTSLYNFPLCTVPEQYRRLAQSTISDWKRRYLPGCDDCSMRSRCGGFFEWYPDSRGFAKVVTL